MSGYERAHNTIRSQISFREEAACRGMPTDMFYPEAWRAEELARAEAPAKAVCATCPVQEDCLEWAMRNNESHGVWGGMGETDRRRLRRGWLLARKIERRREERKRKTS
jgi:WhiB family redox-sensing transcriptional regulator